MQNVPGGGCHNLERGRKGLKATEYSLVVVGLAALVLGGAQILGGDIKTALGDIGSYLKTLAAGLGD